MLQVALTDNQFALLYWVDSSRDVPAEVTGFEVSVQALRDNLVAGIVDDEIEHAAHEQDMDGLDTKIKTWCDAADDRREDRITFVRQPSRQAFVGTGRRLDWHTASEAEFPHVKIYDADTEETICEVPIRRGPCAYTASVAQAEDLAQKIIASLSGEWGVPNQVFIVALNRGDGTFPKPENGPMQYHWTQSAAETARNAMGDNAQYFGVYEALVLLGKRVDKE